MNKHPQVLVFLRAAASMRENRYWARSPREHLAFLGALRDVMTEVCFHADRNQILDPKGLAGYAAVAGAQRAMPWPGATAGTVLLSEFDEAVQRCLAVVEGTDNTGGDRTARPASVGQPAPPS